MKKVLAISILVGLGFGDAGVRAQEPDRLSGGVRMTGASSSAPDVYTVRRGDTLWDITDRFFGNPYHWPEVWSYNPEITNPHWIYPHDHVRLRSGASEAPSLPQSSVFANAPRHRAEGTVWLRDEGYIDREVLEDAGVLIGAPEEQMLLSTFDEIYVRFSDESDVRPGMEFTIFKEMEDEEREVDESGELIRIFGTARLETYDDDRHVGRAVITEALDPIERGFRLARIPRRFEVVPPRENARDLEANVVATLRPQRLVGTQQLIFIDAGSTQGVELGNRFFVVREGDEWRDNRAEVRADYGAIVTDAPEPEEYLREVVAEGRVVDVRENSATLVITGETREVVVGDQLEMRRGF